ncbi:polyisoprenoid-binding protein [Tessaracoccus sp. MC1679]|uniref:YceI family protein n=1 Tax=unclassified Tessaracoccus TaxID=2635419 RepID=UPI0016035AA7|nr:MULTISPECIES: YceI family protein [unclassified Tessaracoccus]MBB1511707.1 polyisoprenoid-binding protein [Tessaracoccus sp. MC1627]MBB1514598.1 polyisoprenoid-binding protein [Tessaracoccus sp. MC1679]
MALNELNGTYVLDPSHSTFSFVTRHAMVTKVRGSFEQFEGAAVVDAANPANTKLDVTIDAASITTRNADRDGHIRSADFFDVENHPTWTFKGTDFAIKGDVVEVTGDLTIKDTTRPITLPLEYQGAAKDPFGNVRVGFEGSTDILRSDFGLTWNAALETGGFLVSDKVAIEVEISAIQQAA